MHCVVAGNHDLDHIGCGGGGEEVPAVSEEETRAEFFAEVRQFAVLIATANSLAVADLRPRPPGSPPQENLYETSDLAEIAEFNGLFQFDSDGNLGWYHACVGHPGVTWRREGEIVAEISIGHGDSVLWKGVGFHVGDGPLAKESRERLAEWSLGRGIPIGGHWGGGGNGDSRAEGADVE